MTAFIDWLERLNESETRVRAILRRSLSFDPAAFVPAYPYVEPFLQKEQDGWRRQAHYLVAGLWAGHWRDGRPGKRLGLPTAAAAHMAATGSASIERRFISLLDADIDQLPHRLRQMVALLRDS